MLARCDFFLLTLELAALGCITGSCTLFCKSDVWPYIPCASYVAIISSSNSFVGILTGFYFVLHFLFSSVARISIYGVRLRFLRFCLVVCLFFFFLSWVIFFFFGLSEFCSLPYHILLFSKCEVFCQFLAPHSWPCNFGCLNWISIWSVIMISA